MRIKDSSSAHEIKTSVPEIEEELEGSKACYLLNPAELTAFFKSSILFQDLSKLPTCYGHTVDWHPGHGTLLAFLNDVSHDSGATSSTRCFPGDCDSVFADTDDLRGVWGTRCSWKENSVSLLADTLFLQNKEVF